MTLWIRRAHTQRQIGADARADHGDLIKIDGWLFAQPDHQHGGILFSQGPVNLTARLTEPALIHGQDVVAFDSERSGKSIPLPAIAIILVQQQHSWSWNTG